MDTTFKEAMGWTLENLDGAGTITLARLQRIVDRTPVSMQCEVCDHSRKSSQITTMKLYMPDKLLPPPENRKANSTHRLSRMELQRAIQDVKRFVENRLESDLHLLRVRVTPSERPR